jgi:hypothetical protein
MSSTQRGYDRHVSDYYITPIRPITEFLEQLMIYEPQVFSDETLFLDPTAGGDAEHPMSYPEALKMYGISDEKIITMDIREDSRAQIKCDYLTHELDFRPDVIFTNPPFLLAAEVIEKALKDVKPGGFVVMLLRLNFFGSKKRKPLFDRHMPKYSFVHSRRISFTADKNTDSIEYQHCVWQSDHFPAFTKLKVI